MDDRDLQEWTDQLQKLRTERREKFQSRLNNKEAEFRNEEFIELAYKSLNQIIEGWWTLEHEALKNTPPKNIGQEQARLKTELEALIEFELSAIETDADVAAENAHWNQDVVKSKFPRVIKNSEELKMAQLIRISSLANEFKKSTAQEEDPRRAGIAGGVGYYASGSRRGGGAKLFWGIVLGLLIGGGPAAYYWQAASKTGQDYEKRIKKILSEKKDLEDSISVFQQNYAALAEGKQKPIPELENIMAPIQKFYSEKRRRVERDFSDERVKLARKIMSRDEFDKQVAQMEVRKKEVMDRLAAREKEDLAPYKKQIREIKENMGSEPASP